jgi:hypothetical protein
MRCCELLVGLERVEVLDVVRHHDRLVVTIESTERLFGSSACGTRGEDHVPRQGGQAGASQPGDPVR